MIQGKYKYITDEFISGKSNHYQRFISCPIEDVFIHFRGASYRLDSFEIPGIDNNYKGLIVHVLNYCRQNLNNKS